MASGSAPVSALSVTNCHVSDAIHVVDNEFRNPRLDLQLVSRSIGITKSHLCRVFRRELGIGLPEYTRKVRVRLAEHLLSDTKLSIKEITAAVGFDHVAQLDRAFKAIWGCGPREFRCRSRLQSSDSVFDECARPRADGVIVATSVYKKQQT